MVQRPRCRSSGWHPKATTTRRALAMIRGQRCSTQWTRANPVPPVFVRGGSYEQQVSFNRSGEPGQPIVVVAEAGEQPILDGSELDAPAGQSAMIEIDGQHDVVVDGLEIAGYRSDVSGEVPIGVFISGAARDVRLANLSIHDLGTTFDGRNGGDAHGIAVYGTSSVQPISGLEIVDSELYDLSLGSSEALVLNGNVKDFLVEGNRVHDTNNIGIDVIGFEGTAPDPTVDQARDGIVRGNEVWNIDSRGNPAYGRDRSADGIYVDGGRDVLVEGNRDPRRQHRDRTGERTCRPSDAEHHRAKQPGVRHDRDWRCDRRL